MHVRMKHKPHCYINLIMETHISIVQLQCLKSSNIYIYFFLLAQENDAINLKEIARRALTIFPENRCTLREIFMFASGLHDGKRLPYRVWLQIRSGKCIPRLLAVEGIKTVLFLFLYV